MYPVLIFSLAIAFTLYGATRGNFWRCVLVWVFSMCIGALYFVFIIIYGNYGSRSILTGNIFDGLIYYNLQQNDLISNSRYIDSLFLIFLFYAAYYKKPEKIQNNYKNSVFDEIKINNANQTPITHQSKNGSLLGDDSNLSSFFTENFDIKIEKDEERINFLPQGDGWRVDGKYRIFISGFFAGFLPKSIAFAKPTISSILVKENQRIFLKSNFIYFSKDKFVIIGNSFYEKNKLEEIEESILVDSRKLIYDYLSGKIKQEDYEAKADEIIAVIQNVDATNKSQKQSSSSNYSSEEVFEYTSKIEKLKQASEMLKDGLISRDEFDRIKNKLIG